MTLHEPLSVQLPFKNQFEKQLCAGSQVLLSGTVYSARDAAHKRIRSMVEKNEPLPIELRNQVIYYCGPSPARPDLPINSSGPTTASRMDPYVPMMLRLGVKGFIGKGECGEATRLLCQQHEAVYFAALGGTAALLSESIVSMDPVCFQDLGTEMIRKFELHDFPAIVIYDTFGNDGYAELRSRFSGERHQPL